MLISSVPKGFRNCRTFTKTSIVFILETVLKMAKETNKVDVGSICAGVTKPDSRKVANAEVYLN